MIESPQDKSTFCSKVMLQGKAQAWGAFKSSFHLQDTFTYTGPLKFSWDNRRRDGCRILGRLDRHYILSPPGTHLHLSTSNYSIRGDYPASDHLPVSIEVKLHDSTHRTSSYKMNTSYLQRAEVKEADMKIWSTERTERSSFFTKIRKFTRFYKSYCKKQAADS